MQSSTQFWFTVKFKAIYKIVPIASTGTIGELEQVWNTGSRQGSCLTSRKAT